MLFYGLGRKIVGVFPLPILAEHTECACFGFFLRGELMARWKNLVKALVRGRPLTLPGNPMLRQPMHLGGLGLLSCFVCARRRLGGSALQPRHQQKNSCNSKNKSHFSSFGSLNLSPRSRRFTTCPLRVLLSL